MDTLTSTQKTESVPLTINTNVSHPTYSNTSSPANGGASKSALSLRGHSVPCIIGTIIIAILALLLLAMLLFAIFDRDNKPYTTYWPPTLTPRPAIIGNPIQPPHVPPPPPPVPRAFLLTSKATSMLRSSWNFIPAFLAVIIALVL